jgi:metal-responsive CopG/Arc/MetJ family transcriptional regulator
VSIRYKVLITATEKPRILVTVEKDLLRELDDLRYDNRISTHSHAVRRLIREGLKKYQKEKPEK